MNEVLYNEKVQQITCGQVYLTSSTAPANRINSVEIDFAMKTKTHTILWADDDTDDLYIVRDVISSIDTTYEMIEVGNGREAVEYLYASSASHELPCLVVLDINMPVLNGKDTLALIRKEKRFDSVTVAVFTTSSNEKDRQFCKKYGAEMYSKPHTYAEFERLVSNLLSLCQPGGNGSFFN